MVAKDDVKKKGGGGIWYSLQVRLQMRQMRIWFQTV